MFCRWTMSPEFCKTSFRIGSPSRKACHPPNEHLKKNCIDDCPAGGADSVDSTPDGFESGGRAVGGSQGTRANRAGGAGVRAAGLEHGKHRSRPRSRGSGKGGGKSVQGLSREQMGAAAGKLAELESVFTLYLDSQGDAEAIFGPGIFGQRRFGR